MTTESSKKLNVGSGQYAKEGYVNIDWQVTSNPDIVHDLNAFPYPFEDNTFEYVEVSHVLEHLDRPFDVMKELHRISKPGGIVHIKVPHFSRGFTHAEHAHGFDVTFPMYFNKDIKNSGYHGFGFDLQKMEMHWMVFFHLLPSMGYGRFTVSALRTLNTTLSWLANLSPALCSRLWCFWVGGFEEIEFAFVCKKD